jgi:hypothetical protein
MRIKISLFLLLMFSLHTMANVGMGKWRTHLAYNIVTQIAQSDNKIYAISEGALFSVDKNDGDMEFYSKMSGLNDTQIASIDFDKANNQLLIVYKNGNIDVMHSAGVNNVPDLRNKQISTSKNINHIFFRGSMAYLSTDFGILLLNMAKREIADTYIIGPNATEIKVIGTTIHNNRIYAVTPNTILAADANNPNLVNFEFWSPLNNLPDQGVFQNMFSFGSKLILLRDDKLYVQENDLSWTQLLPGVKISACRVSNGKLIANTDTDVVYIFDEQFRSINRNMSVSPQIEYDPVFDVFWVAAGVHGVISFKYRDGENTVIQAYKPPGPAVNIPWDITFAGEKMFMVNGGRFAAQYNRHGVVMIYENGIWNNLWAKDVTDPKTGIYGLDFMNVAVNPKDPEHFFVTSYGTGLYEFKNNEMINWYNHLNSPLFAVVPSQPTNYIRLDGAVFDKNGNLFLANMDTGNGIKILKSNGEWTQLYFSSSSQETLGKIIISNQNNNQKWVPSVRKRPGVFIWDDNGTLDDQSDDKSIFYSRFDDVDNVGSYLTPSFIFSIAQDKNGVVWLGTDIGPLLFYNPNRAFETGYTCSRVKIPRNDGTGQADYLLQNERIRAIAIDGANRKWLGTESSGLYLMSENGQETIYHFTTENSPLLSNFIMSLNINPVTGEVFVGTSAGLISFQSDAAEASSTFKDVYAYPNPVRENYNGIITITGLVAKTQVKITDVNGNLIYQTVSNGSIATWDGKDLNGRKVSSGIYLAICASEDGTQSAITKIMVIN